MTSLLRAAAVIAILCGAARPLVAQPLTFSRTDVPSSSGARAIVVADFNRDGRADVAHADVGSDSVAILLGAADGGLAASADLPVGSGPFALATDDFNRDGIADLAVANADSNSLSLLIGRGDGRFVRTDIATGRLRSPRGICAADLNADGKPDLVYSAYESDAVQVLVGDGAGGFAPGAKSVGSVAKPQGIDAADFNHDGYMDIAVASDGARGLVILYGNGAALTAAAVPGAADLNVLALADVNRDGWIDVVAASTARSIVAIYAGSASGLVFRKSYPVDPGPRAVAVADLNSDGVPDTTVVSRHASAAAVLPGDPLRPGTFLPALHFAAGQGSRAVAVADLDGDGLLDLVTGNQYARSVTVLSNQTGLVRSGFAFDTTALPVGAWLVSSSGLAIADFNRDGQLDVVTRGGSRPGDGDAVVVALTGHGDVLLPGPYHFAGFAVADLTRDGNPDVLYIAGGSGDLGGGTRTLLVPYIGNGFGSFRAAPQTASALSLRKCVAGDLNRDARSDLVCVGYDDATGAQILTVFAGRGDGTFRTGTNLALSEAASDLQLADINRDGSLDVVVLQSNAEIWLGNGAGALSRGGGADLAGISYPQHLRVADLNGDARADLIVTANDGELIVSLGNATGFMAASIVGSGAPGEVEIADIDRDGHADLVAAGNTGLVLRGAGDGTFAPAEGFAFVGPAAVADLTGDGLPDIVSHGAAGFRVLVNRRTEVNRPPIVSAPDRTLEFYQVIADPLGDFDCPFLRAEAADPDQHAVSFEWRDVAGTVVSTESYVHICERTAGQYARQLTVRDGRGGVATRTVTLTIRPGKEIVVYAVDLTGDDDVWRTGTWTQVADGTGAGGFRAFDPNRGAPKTISPASSPVSAVRIRFTPDPDQVYKLWVRLKAADNYWGNDSVWVQFSGSTNATGAPVYRIGTASGLAINLEECSGCGVSGWGWEDDGWGSAGRNGVTLRFPDGGRQDILIQTREDGVSVDQVVLSAEKYLTTRPGLAKNDRTILPRTYEVNPH